MNLQAEASQRLKLSDSELLLQCSVGRLSTQATSQYDTPLLNASLVMLYSINAGLQ